MVAALQPELSDHLLGTTNDAMLVNDGRREHKPGLRGDPLNPALRGR